MKTLTNPINPRRMAVAFLFICFFAANLMGAEPSKSAKNTTGAASADLSGHPFAGPLSAEEVEILGISLAGRYLSPVAPVSLTPKQQKLTDIGLVLGGFDPSEGSPLEEIASGDSWEYHQNFFQEIWKAVDENQLNKARKWAETEVDPQWGTQRGLFYPFSGPDFLYAHTFFPNAGHYVLAGLEPVGEVPDLLSMSAPALNGSFRTQQKSLDDILRWSFFRTLDMEVDFRFNQLKGVIPVLMTFITKTGHEILNVEYVGLDSLGELQTAEEGKEEDLWENTIRGTRITFRKKGVGTLKTLVYFSVNLHDISMADQPEVNAFVRKMRYPACYLKSASYLMHKDYFSDVRNIILNNCTMVLQDPSGMPVRFFHPEKWDRRFYGNYTGPIGLFSNYNQTDLHAIYRNHPDIPKIDFGIGYKFRVNTSSFMLALSKPALAWKKQAEQAAGKAENLTQNEGEQNDPPVEKEVKEQPDKNETQPVKVKDNPEKKIEEKQPDKPIKPVEKDPTKIFEEFKKQIDEPAEKPSKGKLQVVNEIKKELREKKDLKLNYTVDEPTTEVPQEEPDKTGDASSRELGAASEDSVESSSKLPWEGKPVIRRRRSTGRNFASNF